MGARSGRAWPGEWQCSASGPGHPPPLRRARPVSLRRPCRPSTTCTACRATESKNCVAVGVNAAADHENGAVLAETWHGTRWTVDVMKPPSGSLGSTLSSVSCVSAKSCVAVGYYFYYLPDHNTETWRSPSSGRAPSGSSSSSPSLPVSAPFRRRSRACRRRAASRSARCSRQASSLRSPRPGTARRGR